MDEACPRTVALSTRLDEQLGAREQIALDRHLAQCPVCAAYFAELQQLKSELKGLPAETLGFDLAEVIRGRLANEVLRRPRARSRPRWRELIPLGIGATVSLMLGLSMGMAITAGASVVVAPQIAVMTVFAPIAPGGLCIDARACAAPRVLTGTPSR